MRFRFALLIPLALGAVMRFYRLGANSLWYDEGYSTFLASEPIAEIVAHTARDIHPPLYYLLLHVWSGLTGISDYALAFPSVIFGLLIVALAGTLGRRWFGATTGLLAATLAAVSPFQIWYSQEVRMYTMAAFFGTLALAAVTAPAKPGPVWRSRDALYVTSAVIGLFTLYYSGFLLAALNLIVLAPLVRGRGPAFGWPVRRWLLNQASVLLLFAPWLPITLKQVLSPAVPPWRDFTPPLDMGTQTLTGLLYGQGVDVSQTAALSLLGLAVIALAFLPAGQSRRWAGVTAAAVFLPVALIGIVSLAVPLFHVRYVFPFSGPFAILLAAGLMAVFQSSRLLGAVTTSAVVLGFVAGLRGYHFDDAYTPDDYRSATAYLSRRWQPGDAILVNAGYVYAPLLHYWPRDVAWRGRLTEVASVPQSDRPVLLQTGTIGGGPQLGGGFPESDFYPVTWQATEQSLDALRQRYARVWVLRGYDTVTDPQGQIREWLDRRGKPFEDQVFGGSSQIRVQGYLLGAGSAPATVVQTDGDLQAGGEVKTRTAPASSDISVDLRWQPTAPVNGTLRALLALVDAQGRIWQQQDEPVLGPAWKPGSWTTGQWTPEPRALAIPPGTPPGAYRVELGAYLAGGKAFEFTSASGRAPRLALGQVQVTATAGLTGPEYLVKAQRDLAPGVRLEGVQFGQFEARAGDALHLDLFWRAGGPRADVSPAIRLVSPNGTDWGSNAGPPVDGRYPSSAWVPGELVRDQRDLIISPRASGLARLEVAIGDQRFTIGDVAITDRTRRYDLPPNVRAVGARFGDIAELAAAETAPVSGRPAAVDLTLIWKAGVETTTNYVVFTQLLDSQNRVVGQRDAPPGGGTAPTTSWVAGEIIVDRISIPVPADAQPGEYRLIVGMYEPRAGARLRLPDGGDFAQVALLRW